MTIGDTILDQAQAILPNASRDECWAILWDETSYPFGCRVRWVMELLKARAAREQAARSAK